MTAMTQAKRDEPLNILERMRRAADPFWFHTRDEVIAEAADEIERLTAECEAWRECAQYDPKMEGPAFKGWNRSALDRCRKQFIDDAALNIHKR